MGKRGAKKAATNNNDFRREEVLQAVVLADSFTQKFRPITAEKPKVLLPLVNIPMIDYTMEFLAAGGVQEVFVICCAHADQVEGYLEKSPWSQKDGFKLHTIHSESFSAGEALRHLDRLDFIKDDFVLISGDVISNIKLGTVLKKHKARTKEDKRHIMTVVMKQASQNHRTRTLDDDTVVALNRDSAQLLMYSNEADEKEFEVDAILFEENSTVQIRYDLMDSHIDICSPEVLMLFTDNFDYQDLRKDFICGVLGSEILGHKITAHVVSGAYAARVKDLRTYDSISKDVIHRWTFPMVPEVNLLAPTTYKYARHNIYREEGVILDRSSKVLEDTAVGSGSSLGAHSVVLGSVLGRNCTIGSNVTITGSYLWGDCVIEDGVTIDKAIICNGVVIKSNAKIEAGVILSFNVVIGAGFTVPPHTAITTLPPAVRFGSEAPAAPVGTPTWDVKEVGPGGVGRVHAEEEEEEEEEDDEEEGSRITPAELRRCNSIAPDSRALLLTVHPDCDSDDEDSESTDDDDVRDFDAQEECPGPRGLDFHTEVQETLTRGMEERLDIDNIVLECASLKLSHDATLQSYSAGVTLAFMHFAGVPPFPALAAAPLKLTASMMQNVTKILGEWKLVLVKFGREKADQVYIIAGLEQACTEADDALLKLFQPMLKELYDAEVIAEDAILEWETARTAQGGAAHAARFVAAASTFLEWLKEADDDEGDEGETESDEDEE